MDKNNFEQALNLYYDLLEEQPEGVSSISITFYEDWAGVEHTYILDTLYPETNPRVHSLATAYVVDDLPLPETREELTEEFITGLSTDLKTVFWTVYTNYLDKIPEEEKEAREDERDTKLAPETLEDLDKVVKALKGGTN